MKHILANFSDIYILLFQKITLHSMTRTCLLLTMVKIIAKRQENIQRNVQLTCEGITFIFNGSAIEL